MIKSCNLLITICFRELISSVTVSVIPSAYPCSLTKTGTLAKLQIYKQNSDIDDGAKNFDRARVKGFSSPAEIFYSNPEPGVLIDIRITYHPAGTLITGSHIHRKTSANPVIRRNLQSSAKLPRLIKKALISGLNPKTHCSSQFHSFIDKRSDTVYAVLKARELAAIELLLEKDSLTAFYFV